ncbi:GNAT family N-acetyltransferase [Mucilaginibacter boryungensis]|uniref:GNAT family N-acetyltransferase n=1 Tax=Mucilaginibacter boryungensis TaxID=768480 RepID=A0ABR9XK64_9SPHI|nr:GNAT family N-acetyltransferase [Mucilaginibacter boryungensis]MBE9667429.1 GNAT family N-acetyltransferase [Mucilaginibacter boryungensis]
MANVLDNPAWNALLSGNQSLAFGSLDVKFFDKSVSPFVGLRDNSDANFSELLELLPHNGPAGFISPVEREIPAAWQILNHIKCYQMVYNGDVKPLQKNISLVPLTEEHIPQMMALTKLTNPGPFAERTIDFGHYYGIFDNDNLVAMTGQRMNPLPYAEISAVCTHPDHLGKGYAQQLLNFHINRIMQEGNIPMLHVRTDNDRAVEVYKKVGFEIRRELQFYIIKRQDGV